MPQSPCGVCRHDERALSAGGLGDELSTLADDDVAVQDLVEGRAHLCAAGELAHLTFERADTVEQVLRYSSH